MQMKALNRGAYQIRKAKRERIALSDLNVSSRLIAYNAVAEATSNQPSTQSRLVWMMSALPLRGARSAFDDVQDHHGRIGRNDSSRD